MTTEIAQMEEVMVMLGSIEQGIEHLVAAQLAGALISGRGATVTEGVQISQDVQRRLYPRRNP